MDVKRSNTSATSAADLQQPDQSGAHPHAAIAARAQQQHSAVQIPAGLDRLAGSKSRPERGAVLGTCAKGSDFRECRGGDSLKDGATDFVKFDQIDYKRTRNGNEGRGSCEGIVREAMRRIDRNEASSLMDAVTYMRSDANLGGSLADHMFDRIDNFQSNRNGLGLTRFDRGAVVHFDHDQSHDRNTRISNLMDAFQHSVSQPGDLAIVRLGLYPQGVMSGSERGHALLVQRNADDSITTFDPDNAAFVHPDEQHWRRAMRGYLDTAFTETGYAVVPDNIQSFTAPRADQRAAGLATPEPLPPVTPPEPPLKLFPGWHREDL
jgi:hypothetical protein